MTKIILFDGVCKFCDRSVQFIIKRDKKEQFKFASLQSDVGRDLLRKFNIPENINSFILLENNKYYIKSSASLRVCKNLTGMWKLLYLFVIVPRPVRDFVYERIAQNRYKWFGTKEQCMLPSKKERDRFL